MVAAMTMVFGMSGLTAFAEELTQGTAGTAKTITITSPAGVGANDTTTYTVYKVLNAKSDETSTNISYTAANGITLPITAGNAKLDKDTAGNVHYYTFNSENDEWVINTNVTQLPVDLTAAIGNAVSNTTAVGTVTITGPSKEKTVIVPDYGYYYITTTTGSLVDITSTNPCANVTDKNTVSSVDDKKATSVTEGGTLDTAGHNAIAQVGSTVSFEATVTLGKGATGVKFHDTMTDGLSLNVNNINVTGLPSGVTADIRTSATGDNAKDVNDTFTVVFNGAPAENTQVTITYTATVTSNALSTNPAKNTASITYGDNNNSTPGKVVNVYNAKFTVNKTFEGTLNAGDSAQFILKRSNDNKYYKFDAATESESAKVEWVDEEDDATKLTFTEDGSLAFTGLDNGTYTVIESKVPAGFNKAADKTFTIKGANEETSLETSNLEQSENVVNKAGSALPSTGGMGTTIFYVLGAALVIGAGVVLVTRRRLSK